MKNIEKLVRKNILNLKPYSSARDEYKGKDGIFLDANENPFGSHNRYPDPYQMALKMQLSNLKKIAPEQIFVGNGSDEAIDLLYRIFCEPARDKALTLTPSYGMYKVSANINNVELIELPLDSDFQINTKQFHPYLKDETLKLIFLCSPNNPTGNILDYKTIIWLLENFKGVVVIDEAYIDFALSPSFISKVNHHSNLVVLQTMSKAWGQAALRIGFAYSNAYIIQLMNKVKPPYNVSGPTQQLALNALLGKEQYEEGINKIIQNRKYLQDELLNSPLVIRIYPTDANFLLIEVTDADELYRELAHNQIVVRNRNSQIKNCLRITVGTTEENIKLINQFKRIAYEKSIVSR